MNRNPIFVTTGRAAGHSYPAHELLEGYAVTLYDLDVSREQATIRLNGGKWDANVDQIARENRKLRETLETPTQSRGPR